MKPLTLFIICLLILTGSSQAQIINRKAGEVKDKAGNRVENRSSESIDRGLDKIEEGIGNIFKKKEKKKKEKNADNGNTSSSKSSSSTSEGEDEPTDFSAYKKKNFDFVAGKRIIFFEDFANRKIGVDTASWFMNAWSPGTPEPGFMKLEGAGDNWFKTPQKGLFFPNALNNISLPSVFTLEFDLYADLQTMSEMEGGLKAIFVSNKTDKKEFDFHFNDHPQVQIDIHPSIDFFYLSAIREYGLENREIYKDEIRNGWKANEVHRVSISRNGSQVKVYIDETKYIDLPNALPAQLPYTLLFATNMWGDGMYMSNIRLATDLQNAKTEVAAEGKFTTNSIYFDVNSAWIKPESWATLKQIATVINNMNGNFLIIGHTDSDGADEANLTLSQKRASSVKNALINEFGVKAERLSTDGKGETQPITSNNTTLGKAQNRRVEFIKQ